LFEFHGWATIRVDDLDDADLDVIRNREDQAIAEIRAAILHATDDFSLFEVCRTSNALIVLSAHGLRNHRYEPVITLFQWVAENLPFAYGLLYVHDDEDFGRDGTDHSNGFRVWRLARGQFSEFADSFLSPYIPTVEPPWEWPKDSQTGGQVDPHGDAEMADEAN
jgi:hypothetical protein